MSRFWAGLGGGVGVMLGGVAGTYAGAAFPGRMTQQDSMSAWGIMGAILGGALGGLAGAGPDCAKPASGTVGDLPISRPEPRFP
jgi:MFS family permease